MNKFVALASATANLQAWIKGNIIPLLLLLIAFMLFVFAQRGDNSKAMRVVAGVIIALAVLVLTKAEAASCPGPVSRRRRSPRRQIQAAADAG